jgi:hypothetical protein
MHKKYCQNCGRAIKIYNWRKKAWVIPDDDHDICRQCWSSQLDSMRAKGII